MDGGDEIRCVMYVSGNTLVGMSTDTAVYLQKLKNVIVNNESGIQDPTGQEKEMKLEL